MPYSSYVSCRAAKIPWRKPTKHNFTNFAVTSYFIHPHKIDSVQMKDGFIIFQFHPPPARQHAGFVCTLTDRFVSYKKLQSNLFAALVHSDGYDPHSPRWTIYGKHSVDYRSENEIEKSVLWAEIHANVFS